MIGRWCTLRFPPQLPKKPLLSLRARVCHPNTRTHVRLLGPCFKTGWLQPFRPHHDVTDPEGRVRVTLLLNLQARQERRAIIPEGYLPNSRLPRHKIDVDLHTPTIWATSETNDWRKQHWLQSVPFQRFQALFNSLFKVLSIFPSRYLFAIGLSPIFSFRRNLPPNLSCSPKQLDSSKAHRT